MTKSIAFVKKRKIIMKEFTESQFGYFPLFWMFHSRAINNKRNRIHERALKITYSNNSSSFQSLLDRDMSFTIPHRNIRTLAIETFKVYTGFPHLFWMRFFVDRNYSFNLRGNNSSNGWRVNSIRYGTEWVSFLASKYGTSYQRKFWKAKCIQSKNQELSSSRMPLWTL